MELDAGAAELRHVVGELAQPRSSRHDPVAARETEEFLAVRFAGAGWEVERQGFTRGLAVGVRGRRFGIPWVYRAVTGTNVVARKPGDGAGQVVVVAHRDTVRASPGADDNASGLAVLVALAGMLGPMQFKKTVVLAATDQEEMWAMGAAPLVKALQARGPIDGAIVLDAVGYTSGLGTQRLPPGFGLGFRAQSRSVRRRGRPGDFTALIHDVAAGPLARDMATAIEAQAGRHTAALLGVPAWVARLGGWSRGLAPVVSVLCRSDNRAFWAARVPTVLATDTGNYRSPHYHRASDVPDTLDYEHLRAVVAGCMAAVVAAADR